MAVGGGLEPLGLELFLRGIQAFVAGGQRVINTVRNMRTAFAGAAADKRFTQAFATQADALDAYTRAGLRWNAGAKQWIGTSGQFVSGIDAHTRALQFSEQSFASAGISMGEFDERLQALGLTYGDMTPQQLGMIKQWEEMGESAEGTGKKTSELDKTLGSLRRTFIRLGASMAAMIIVRKVIELFGELIAVSKELESVEWRLERRIEAMERTFEHFEGSSTRFLYDIRAMGREMEVFTERDLANAAMKLMAMGVPLGLTQKQIMALTRSTAELAAVNGVELDDAISAVTTGFTGQSRALKRYGVDVSEATLNAKSYQMGLNKNFDELTKQEQAHVRLNVILEQTIELYGTAAESTETYAGAQAHAARGAERLAAELGEGLLPPLTDITDLAGELAERTADSKGAMTSLSMVIASVLMPVLGPLWGSLLGISTAISAAREHLGWFVDEGIVDWRDYGDQSAMAFVTADEAARRFIGTLEDIDAWMEGAEIGARRFTAQFDVDWAGARAARSREEREFQRAQADFVERWKEAGRDIADYQAEWHDALLAEDARYNAARLELLDDQLIKREDRIQDFQRDQEDRLEDHQKKMRRLYADYMGNLEDLERDSARKIADIEEERAIRGDEILEKALKEQLAALEQAEREGAPENLIKTIRLNIARLQAEMIRTGAFRRKQALDKERENLEDRKKDLEEDYTKREGRAKEDYGDRKTREEDEHRLDMERLKRNQEDRIEAFDAQHVERTKRINEQYTERIAQVREREGEITEDLKTALGKRTTAYRIAFGQQEELAAEHTKAMIAMAGATGIAWSSLMMPSEIERLLGPRPYTGPYADQYGAEGIATGPMMRMFGEAGPEYYRHVPLSGPASRVYHQTQTNTVYFGPNNIRSSRDIGRTASKLAHTLGTEAKLRQDFGG